MNQRVFNDVDKKMYTYAENTEYGGLKKQRKNLPSYYNLPTT